MPVKAIPEGYRSLTPYLYFDKAGEAIEFYKKAFGAKERMRMAGPNNTVGHAELEIGDSVLMMADNPDRSPKKTGGATSSFLIYTEDADALYKRALEAGARELQPLEDKFYGDRMGMVTDPFGHEWSIGTHIEDVSPEEMQKRAQQAMAQSA